MALTPGTRLGPYEVTAQIGEGGMGEVYRARDSRLKRDVALKILPEAFARDHERMFRFQREAELLASLNHPNIATIHGVEENALVMELVEGNTIGGPRPLTEALQVARQMAEALEYAHERGVIHRDLKPANVKVTPDGVVKLLDFGLAKAIEDPAAASDLSNSPTLTLGATRAGVILGTAAYMSPEQAHGKSADRRSDIWSFGAVLYEMLTGKPTFTGESVSDTLASVLKIEPDWNALPPETPIAIRTLLRRCLTRDRKQRLQAIGEARIVLDDVLSGKGSEDIAALKPGPAPRGRGAMAGWIAAGVLALIAAVAVWSALRPSPAAAPSVVRLIAPGAVASVAGAIALSPDGSLLAFAGGPKQQIYLRAIDQFDARPLNGTEGAAFLGFSPDGQWISFVSGVRFDGRLKKVSVAGGPVQTLAEVPSGVGPPTQRWGQDGNILFAKSGVLTRLSSNGGTPETLAAPDAQQNEQYYAGPQLLPDGQHVLVSIYTGGGVSSHRIVAFNLQTREKKMLLERAGVAQYIASGASSASGHIVYYDSATAALMAVPFDPERLAIDGSPAPVLEGVQGPRGPFGLFGISESGTLAYVAGSPLAEAGSTLVWVDRDGTEEPLKAPARAYTSVRLSPDGQRIAVAILGDSEDIWVYDLSRGTTERLTSEGYSAGAIWASDGKRVFYERRPPGGAAVLSVPTDGSGPPSIVTTWKDGPIAPSSVSSDGRLLLGWYPLSKGIWVTSLPEALAGRATFQPFLDSRVVRSNPAFSPDGKWIVYRSDETGRAEIYVAPYPGPGGRFPISTSGGTVPRWSRTGRELFYRNADKVMAVSIEPSPTFRAGTPTLLFEKRYANSWDVDVEGKRFLMINQPAVQQTTAEQLNVVLNWFEELRRRVPPASR